MRKLIILIWALILACLVSATYGQQTLIKVKDWNAYVHLPSDYHANPERAYPTILFIPGLGEIGTTPSKVIQNGPGAYLNQGWNGEALGVKFIIISLQPASAWPPVSEVKKRVDELRTRYRIGDVTMTGLSMGGWASLYYSYTYSTELKRVVGVESVVPSEGAGTDYAQRIHDTYKVPAQAGINYVLFEQANDWRRNDQVVDAMNYWQPGSANYQYTSFGGGGHCCWSSFYGGGGQQPGRFTIFGINQNIYEWIARESTVLATFITSVYLRDNTLSWQCDNVEAGDYFVVSESVDGISYRDVMKVPGIGQTYKVTL